MGLAWRGMAAGRGYKSDPNTQGAPPDLRNQPATQPRFRPPITTIARLHRATVERSAEPNNDINDEKRV